MWINLIGARTIEDNNKSCFNCLLPIIRNKVTIILPSINQRTSLSLSLSPFSFSYKEENKRIQKRKEKKRKENWEHQVK
jgi:hypothetical protein